ncbi:MAG: DUF2798 domain-containing protein, partial [Pseudolabrys sp.]
LQRLPPAIPLRIRNPCQIRPVALNCGIHVARGQAMEGKARFIFPVIISALIVFVVSGVVTFTNIGFRVDFVPRWLKDFMTGWPVAAVLAFFAIPHVRRATEAIVRLIEGQA